MKRVLLCAAMGLASCVHAAALLMGATACAQSGGSVDRDGTLHAQDLTIPPSGFWSPEFKAYYAKYKNASSQTDDLRIASRMPGRNAPKEEWDKFDAFMDGENAELLSRALKRYPVEVQDTRLGGVRVGIITPKNGVTEKNKHRVLLNLHGGGFVANRGLIAGQLESVPVASLGQFKVVTIDYRQAPFHEYPAASEDVEAVYRELLKQYDSDAIGMYGCSAGGWITSQVVVRLRAKTLPRPGAVGLFCVAPPGRWATGDSRFWSFLPNSQLSEAEKAVLAPYGWYHEHADANDPQAYPATSDEALAQFPPTLLLVGGRDLWLSPVIVAHARFLKLGVDSSLYVMEGAPHGAHVGAVDTPEARDANACIAKWFDQKLAW